jgi:hypothetical protein
MAEKNKAYRRFEQLTRRAMDPTVTEAEPDPDSAKRGTWSFSAEALSIQLSPDVRRALEEHAAANNTTPSEIVQNALRRYLALPG